MSGIGAIRGTSPYNPSRPIRETKLDPKPQSTALERNQKQPEVVINLASKIEANPSNSVKLPTLDPNAVDNALARVGAANGFAFLAAHTDWAGIEKQYRKAIADRDKGSGIVASEVSYALSSASHAGIVVKSSIPLGEVKEGVTVSFLKVESFSFNSGGSIYRVTNGKDGVLLGTKDGQYWRRWELNPPSGGAGQNTNASTALQTPIASRNADNASDKPTSTLDVSA